ncbi:glycosyltransferase [Vulcanisaeta thermophila]|uniref:glycosyltransferase n=1 Tax=Vulcanisaeta thermophila TaxID=867917 RepID=UPI000853A39D|nr:glycosyltransferase family A protein [Vulcanisaeta thermophila]
MISVVMTTYNAGRTIKMVLEGLFNVLNELGLDYELVVVDNESRDGTIDVLREFGARVKVMRCTRGRGRHEAALMSKGDYLLFYDADAYANPNLLSNFIEVTLKHGYEFALAHTGVYIMRRSLYVRSGGFMDLNFGEDIHLWARAFPMGRSIYFPIRVACNAPRIYAVRGYRGELRYARSPLYFILRLIKNETHRLRGLGLGPMEILNNAIKSNDLLMIMGALYLGPLSPIIGNRIVKSMSNLELLFNEELIHMGNIDEVSPDGGYLIQDIFHVRGWQRIYREFRLRLSKYDVSVIHHPYAEIIYSKPDIVECPPP